ncbi:protein trichome birefringence-like 19 [Hordeum vulgare subsp. vulgare]|uniref:Trichome birefringence-like N-terminal domain-containing protein n=1 Tax=Hordeum vulgare subsp. vulgare TaxID=112509 RepID=A0A8I7BFS5_HORVV|nr:protein trichome birefringence-like 19 [Hordeum vulgare subsp. vulgare]
MRKHCSSSARCFVPVVSLMLLAALLAASNLLYTTFPNLRPFFSSHLKLHTRGGGGGGRGEGEGCDIFSGDWVPDPDAPYYTNDTCSVIHEHYDCMRFGKPDLGFVNWRWRPDGDGCDLPRFDPARFLALMRGKTIAFVGDSLARNHKDSLICLLTRVAEPRMSWPSSKHTVYHYGEYNFTVASFWAPYLVRHEQIDDDGPAHTGLWNLHLDEPEDVWAARIPELDYAVVSASSWFYRPSMLYEAGRLVGCHYCKLPNVTDLTPRHALRMATRAALRALSGADGRFRGTALLRTVDPSQYEGGQWSSEDGNCVRTAPQRRGERRVEGLERDFRELQVEELAAAERAAAGGVRMMLMDTTEAMVLRADAHPSKYRGWTPEKHFTLYNDCVHWCLPGAIDTWNDMLLHMINSTYVKKKNE